jgi:hypothetical protein
MLITIYKWGLRGNVNMNALDYSVVTNINVIIHEFSFFLKQAAGMNVSACYIRQDLTFCLQCKIYH